MSKQKKNPGTKSQKTKLKTSSKVLYGAAVVVILIPVVLLAYIYFGAKENSGKPVTGSRFGDALDPAIASTEVTKVKDALNLDGVEAVEVNLKSATLRIDIDTTDTITSDALSAVMESAYSKVNEILPVATYFSNKADGTKMYDLDIHVYNYIPDETRSQDGMIYKELIKNAANTEIVRDTLSSPKNAEVADDLLKEQEEASK